MQTTTTGYIDRIMEIDGTQKAVILAESLNKEFLYDINKSQQTGRTLRRGDVVHITLDENHNILDVIFNRNATAVRQERVANIVRHVRKKNKR